MNSIKRWLQGIPIGFDKLSELDSDRMGKPQVILEDLYLSKVIAALFSGPYYQAKSTLTFHYGDVPSRFSREPIGPITIPCGRSYTEIQGDPTEKDYERWNIELERDLEKLKGEGITITRIYSEFSEESRVDTLPDG